MASFTREWFVAMRMGDPVGVQSVTIMVYNNYTITAALCLLFILGSLALIYALIITDQKCLVNMALNIFG